MLQAHGRPWQITSKKHSSLQTYLAKKLWLVNGRKNYFMRWNMYKVLPGLDLQGNNLFAMHI